MSKTLVKMNFDPEIAKDVGTDAAIIFENICFWVWSNKTKQEDRNDQPSFNDGRWWTYNSAKAFAMQFTWLSTKQIWRNLKKLEDCGYIVTGNFNKVKYDRTKWYSVNGKYIGQERKIEIPKTENRNSDSDQPIPNNNTNDKREREKLSHSEVEGLTKKYHITLKALQKVHAKYLGWCDLNGKNPSKAYFLNNFLPREEWDISDLDGDGLLERVEGLE